MEFFIDFLKNNFSQCMYIAIILVAMCPMLESKIAIPLAMNGAIWGNQAMSPITSFLLSVFANMLPCLLILIIVRKLKQKTTGFVSNKLIAKYGTKSNSLDRKYNNFQKYLALTAFLAVPLPLTGVWSGSIIAGLTNMKIKYAFLSIFIGNIISAGVVTLICLIFKNSISYILIFSILIIIIFLFIDLFVFLCRKKNKVGEPVNINHHKPL